MFEEACFVETGVVAALDSDFVIVDAIRACTVCAEFTRNTKSFLNGYCGTNVSLIFRGSTV